MVYKNIFYCINKLNYSPGSLEKEFQSRLELQKEYLGEKKPINLIEPLVSITIVTYQHAPYIRKCIDSVLMQKTSFPFEILIGEDQSTDGTREICIEYAERYPDKIRLFLRDRSLSQFEFKDGKIIRFNGLFNYKKARGKYIAICEGDDYWTDEDKLSIQIAEMERDESVSICSHDYIKYIEKEKIFEKNVISNILETKPDVFYYSNEDKPGWITQPLTMIYRNSCYPIHEFFKFQYWRDNHLVHFLLKSGKGVFINKVMGVYRITGKGIYTSLNKIDLIEIEMRAAKELYYNEKYPYLKERLFNLCYSILTSGEYFKHKNCYEKYMVIYYLIRTVNYKKFSVKKVVNMIKKTISTTKNEYGIKKI